MSDAHDEPVRYEKQGPVATVTMNRPDYRNAQNSAMTYALDRAFYRAADDSEVKTVVLAGAGKHFSMRPRHRYTGAGLPSAVRAQGGALVGPLGQGGCGEPLRP